jgi:c-opsin
MTPLNWMLLNLACSDGAIAGFGYKNPFHSNMQFDMFQFLFFFLDGKRTPISAAAALKFTWPFSQELCVAYAMIMSTAGQLLIIKSIFKKKFFLLIVRVIVGI